MNLTVPSYDAAALIEFFHAHTWHLRAIDPITVTVEQDAFYALLHVSYREKQSMNTRYHMISYDDPQDGAAVLYADFGKRYGKDVAIEMSGLRWCWTKDY